MTAAEFARSVAERHERERHTPWRAWVTPCAVIGVALFFGGTNTVHATVRESIQWWIGGCAVFAAVAVGLCVTTVSLVDIYRDGRDFVKLRRLMAQERNEQ